jgi:hypothetical protein
VDADRAKSSEDLLKTGRREKDVFFITHDVDEVYSCKQSGDHERPSVDQGVSTSIFLSRTQATKLEEGFWNTRIVLGYV